MGGWCTSFRSGQIRMAMARFDQPDSHDQIRMACFCCVGCWVGGGGWSGGLWAALGRHRPGRFLEQTRLA